MGVPRVPAALLVVILGCVAWSSARGAEAQPAATDADKRAVAKRYVDAGLAAEAVKDYKAAVDLYLRAYDLVPHPLLIYNMGEAYRLGGQHAEALAHFKRYLAADPRGVRAADAASKIGPLEKAVKQEEARKADEARKAEEARRAQEARLAELARLAEEARAAEAAQAAEVERARAAEEQQRVEAARLVQAAALRRRADRWRLAGIGTTVAGASALAVGGYFGYRARSLSNEVSEQYDSTKAAEGERLERLQVIALVGGGVVTATGVALIVVGWRKGRHVPPIAVTPTSDRAGAVVSFTGGW